LAVNENLFRKLEELELCVQCANNIDWANIQFVGDLAQHTEQDLLMKNFGKKSCKCMKKHLAKHGPFARYEDRQLAGGAGALEATLDAVTLYRSESATAR
jgi:DNA-directed RNA polymerase alpha subunit